MALDILEWNHDEVRFAMEGKLLYTNPADSNWKKGRTIKLNPINALLVTNGKVRNLFNVHGIIENLAKTCSVIASVGTSILMWKIRELLLILDCVFMVYLLPYSVCNQLGLTGNTILLTKIKQPLYILKLLSSSLFFWGSSVGIVARIGHLENVDSIPSRVRESALRLIIDTSSGS